MPKAPASALGKGGAGAFGLSLVITPAWRTQAARDRLGAGRERRREGPLGSVGGQIRKVFSP